MTSGRTGPGRTRQDQAGPAGGAQRKGPNKTFEKISSLFGGGARTIYRALVMPMRGQCVTRATGTGTGTGCRRQHIIHKAIIKGMNAMDSIGHTQRCHSVRSLFWLERDLQCASFNVSCVPGVPGYLVLPLPSNPQPSKMVVTRPCSPPLHGRSCCIPLQKQSLQVVRRPEMTKARSGDN